MALSKFVCVFTTPESTYLRQKLFAVAGLCDLAMASVVYMYFRRADTPQTSRGDAVAATWIFRGDESQRRRGRDVDLPRRRVAATLPRE